jgi:hypothetical protein
VAKNKHGETAMLGFRFLPHQAMEPDHGVLERFTERSDKGGYKKRRRDLE